MDSIEIKVPGLAAWCLSAAVPAAISRPSVEGPKKATRKRTSSVKPKPAAAKKAPAKAKTAKATAKPKAKKAANKKAAPKAKAGAVKASGKEA